MDGNKDFLLFSGSSHQGLAESVAKHLNQKLGKVLIETFPDNEIGVQILENVRGRDVFVLQSIARQPNLYLMELFIMIDALKRASAASICVVIPYFGYARQDRKHKGRVPITARLVANLIEKAGASRVLTVDLHADQVQGFFDIPTDHLTARDSLACHIEKECAVDVVVAPDLGSIKYGRYFASRFGCEFAVIDKRRVDAECVEKGALIGDVSHKNVLLVDDICSTGGTLKMAALVCRKKRAKTVFAAVTHGVYHRFEPKEDGIEKFYVTDTVPGVIASERIEVVSIAALFARAILAIVTKSSISSLF